MQATKQPLKCIFNRTSRLPGCEPPLKFALTNMFDIKIEPNDQICDAVDHSDEPTEICHPTLPCYSAISSFSLIVIDFSCTYTVCFSHAPTYIHSRAAKCVHQAERKLPAQNELVQSQS